MGQQLVLVGDAVIYANNVITHVDRKTRLAEELIVCRVGLRNDSGSQVCQSIGVKQRRGHNLTGPRAALYACRASSGQFRSPCRIAYLRNIQNDRVLDELWRNIRKFDPRSGSPPQARCSADRRRIALDQFAPLFIPEEECLRLVLVVDLRDDRAGRRFGNRRCCSSASRGRVPCLVVLVAVCIESCVAVELPEFSMELLGAALQREADRGAGRDAVVRRIV